MSEKTAKQHSMSCEYPEGCSCGATKFNSLLTELESARKDVKRMDHLAGELQREQDCGMDRVLPEPSLFRRNEPITRAMIDANIAKLEGML